MEISLPLLLGVGTLAAVIWGRGRRPSNAAGTTLPEEGTTVAEGAATSARSGRAPFISLPGKWVWPVPITRGRVPVISSGWGSPRGDRQHEGADVMFRRVASDPYPVRSPNGSKLFVMPENVLAVAAADGKVWSAGRTPRGFSVVIDHGETAKVATYYTHMDTLMVQPTSRGRSGERVVAGQPLGIIGADPLDGNHLKHLHFALWAGGPSDAVDPQPLMKSWAMIRDPRETAGPGGVPSPSSSGSAMGGSGGPGAAGGATGSPERAGGAAASSPGPMASLLATAGFGAAAGRADLRRNAGLSFQPVGASGERYPDWVRQLRGKSGVYFIRERSSEGNPELVYIGQSQAGRLYETLTRHFQGWRRWKGFWRGQFAEGHDPGLTYPRHQVEVAVRVTPPSRALEEEARFIRKLRPRDNVIGQFDDLADVPF